MIWAKPTFNLNFSIEIAIEKFIASDWANPCCIKKIGIPKIDLILNTWPLF